MAKALAVLRGEGNVSGNVTFEQADENSPVIISGTLYNLTVGKHGFHVQ